MAKKGNEYTFMGGVEKLAGILTGMAEELDKFAESLEVSDKELAELNAGKTENEINLENTIAAQIASPLVNALDGMTAIINGATAKIMGLTTEPPNGDENA